LSAGTIRLFIAGRIRLPQRLFLQVVDILSGDSVRSETPTATYGRRPPASD
jgi:hypothetical protein